jgi:hypothetical protein
MECHPRENGDPVSYLLRSNAKFGLVCYRMDPYVALRAPLDDEFRVDPYVALRAPLDDDGLRVDPYVRYGWW